MGTLSAPDGVQVRGRAPGGLGAPGRRARRRRRSPLAAGGGRLLRPALCDRGVTAALRVTHRRCAETRGLYDARTDTSTCPRRRAGSLPRRADLHYYRMTGSYSEAEDLVQETFARALRAAEGFGGRASVRTWLYPVETSVCGFLDPSNPNAGAYPSNLNRRPSISRRPDRRR